MATSVNSFYAAPLNSWQGLKAAADTRGTALYAPEPGAGAADGREAANFEILLEVHREKLIRFLFLRTHDLEQARDLTQECFLRALTHREGFRGDCSLGTWLCRIALNLFYDSLRKSRRLTTASGSRADFACALSVPDTGLPSAERRLLGKERLGSLHKLLEQASPFQREAFLCRFFKEMTIAQIASRMGTSRGSVKSALHRVQVFIRTQGKSPGHSS